MIIAQSAATSRAFAQRCHESVDDNADILRLSAANVVAAISGAFVVNGSPTQKRLFRVIRYRVASAANPAMSAVPPKAGVNSEH